MRAKLYYVCVANLKTKDGRDVFDHTKQIDIQTGTEADEDSPEIVAMSPPDESTNLPVTTQVAVLFDEEVSLASAAAAITLEDSAGNVIDGSFHSNFYINGGRRVLFIPYNILKPFSTYTFTVSGVPDLAGNLSPTQSIVFTTGNHIDAQQYQAIFEVPEGRVKEVGTNTTVVVGYNEPLDITSILSKNRKEQGKRQLSDQVWMGSG